MLAHRQTGGFSGWHTSGRVAGPKLRHSYEQAADAIFLNLWERRIVCGVTRPRGRSMIGEFNLMSKQDEYLDNAAQTLELATRASSPSERSRLLGLADKWLDLADRIKRSAPQLDEHPLVRRTFRGLPPE